MQSQFIIVVLDVLSVLSRGRARASGQATQERKRKVEAVMHQRTMSYVLHESECGSMAGQHERRKRKVEHVMHQRQCRRSCTTANHLGEVIFYFGEIDVMFCQLITYLECFFREDHMVLIPRIYCCMFLTSSCRFILHVFILNKVVYTPN